MFETRFSVFETDKLDRFNDTEIVAMVTIVSIIVTKHASIVAWMDGVIDVGQVVASDLLGDLIS